MRIKYKTPHNIFYRRFWRVTAYSYHEGDGYLEAVNKRGKILRLPLSGTVIIIIP